MGLGFVMIDGVLYIRSDFGGMDSGSKNTSRGNTIFRLCYDAYIFLLLEIVEFSSMANGDDCTSSGEVEVQSYLDAANSFGLRIRDAATSENSFDFCSHRYDLDTGLATLISWPKAVYRMLCEPGIGFSDAWQVVGEMRHNKEVNAVASFVASLDLPARS